MDIRKVIESRFGSARVTHGQNGTEYLVVCPHCGKRKLSINPQKGVYQCWHGCDSGSLSRLLRMKIPASYRPVIRHDTKSRGYTPPGELIPLSSLSRDHQAILYLRGRGFDPESLESDFGVCYCSHGSKYAGGIFDTTNTVVLPIRRNGELVGWQSRLLYNPDKVPAGSEPFLGWKLEDGKYVKPPKYMTMPGYGKRSSLYNIDSARQGEVVVVTEGAFDCMRVGKCGVATFGKGVSDEQVDLIRNIWKVAVLLLDPDAPEEQSKLAASLGRSILTVPVTLSGYKDAGECPRDELWRQIEAAAANDNVFRREGITLDSFSFQR